MELLVPWPIISDLRQLVDSHEDHETKVCFDLSSVCLPLLCVAASDCSANRFVSLTMRLRISSSKKWENISSGFLLQGTCGPTGTVQGLTVTCDGVRVQPLCKFTVIYYYYVALYTNLPACQKDPGMSL